MSCKDNKDGSCSVEYVPFTAGLYDVNITYGGEHIPGELTFSNMILEALSCHDSLCQDPCIIPWKIPHDVKGDHKILASTPPPSIQLCGNPLMS